MGVCFIRTTFKFSVVRDCCKANIRETSISSGIHKDVSLDKLREYHTTRDGVKIITDWLQIPVYHAVRVEVF